MSGINSVCISGNLTRDAELRATGTGAHVLSFSVAVSESRKDPDTGEWTERPNYVDCSIWGSRAVGLAPHLLKGTKVMVSGRLRWHSWDQTGERRSKLDVVVDRLDFGAPARQQHESARTGHAPEVVPPEVWLDGEEIPF